MGRLSNLEDLQVKNNMLTGVVNENKFTSLTKLTLFSASENHLTLKLSPDWNPPFKLKILTLGTWNLGADIPSWLDTQFTLQQLDLSNTGNIPDLMGPYSWSICLTSNQFSGPLPRVGNSVIEINLSNNSFSGGDNNFSGTIPNSIGTLTSLMSLNLYDNMLSGQIPVSISNCTGLVKIDLSGNNLVRKIPIGIGTSLAKLRFLILQSNKLGGIIPWSICHLNLLQILDLSNNSFSGRIPSCLCNLTAMAVKRNLSEYIGGELDFSSYYDGGYLESASVATKGRETHYDTILSLVNNIDLSSNHLSGGI
ncbi:hypothetical protein ACS0TY_010154 [Phlomoides rotata]